MKTSLKSSVKSAPLISPSLLPLCADVFLNSALDWKLPLTICDLCAYALVGKAALWDAASEQFLSVRLTYWFTQPKRLSHLNREGPFVLG